MGKIDQGKTYTETLTGRIKMRILAIPEPPHVTPEIHTVTLNLIQDPHQFLICHATL